MSILQLKKWLFPGVVLLSGLLAVHVGAEPDHSTSRQQGNRETPAEITKKALAQTVSFDLVHHPLSEIVRLIQNQSEVHFVLDRQGLARAGINPDDMIVSTRLSATLGSVLQQILNQCGLDYAVIGDMVFLTTEELAIHRQMQQPVQVRFDRLQLHAALDRLARETATNLVLDRPAFHQANTPVSLKLDNAPLEAVVKLLAHQVGLKQIRVGNVLIVTTKGNAAELQDSKEIPQTVMPAPAELERMIYSGFHLIIR